ncbi:HEPN domain-containing protein [Clostridium paridis]|uniref:HEPN domain-containing protein n=1 Tax=Clostridium paridis TaxID=2803863 RepID=A0A937FF25_9CLOT|nr:HEPN domain-containing protein [Clostridium paridis]MBL4930813.1 HEPN domain-containing protein [Clostridium paridis]
MDFNELKNYSDKNKYILSTIPKATEDYISARCLIINGILNNGLILVKEAIDKYLKAYIWINDENFDPRGKSFTLEELVESAKKNGLDLAIYTGLIRKISEFYKLRYTDNLFKLKEYKAEDLYEIDSLIIYLNNSLKLPPEIKFRILGIEHYISFDLANSIEIPKNHYLKWLEENNKPVKGLIKKLEPEYFAFKRSLTP